MREEGDDPGSSARLAAWLLGPPCEISHVEVFWIVVAGRHLVFVSVGCGALARLAGK